MNWISGQIIFVVWREAMEGIFIVGLLSALLTKINPRGLRAMWIGVGGGVLLSLLLASLLVSAQGFLTGNWQLWFQVGIMLLSSVLMVQMYYWMKSHGRQMKNQMETDLRRQQNRLGYWGIAVVSALSIGREGSEAVIYVYSITLEKTVGTAATAVSVVIGIFAALLLAYAFSHGLRSLSQRTFMRITGALLLVSAAGLLSNAIGQLVSENVLPGIVEPLWDTGAWFGDFISQFLKVFAGYQPRPSLLEVIFYCSFWLLVLAWNQWSRRQGEI